MKAKALTAACLAIVLAGCAYVGQVLARTPVIKSCMTGRGHAVLD